MNRSFKWLKRRYELFVKQDEDYSLLVYKDTSFPFNYGRIQTRSTSRSSSTGTWCALSFRS